MKKYNFNIKTCLSIFICSVFIFLYFVIQPQTFLRNGLSKDSFAEEIDLDLMFGQNIIIGIPASTLSEPILKIIHNIKPGGIVLYRRNYESSEQFKSLIEELQVVAQEDSGMPYFIMIDEEPGGASRLDLLNNVFTLSMPDWGAINEGISKLSEMGITVELAPVADFHFNENSFIKKRVPAHNFVNLESFNQTFIRLLNEHNIYATLKHFPGAGVFINDPHSSISRGYVQEDFLNQSLSLFKSGIDAGAQFVMINHAIYENIDSQNPATLSNPIVTGLLKNKLGFNGIIITDDIQDMLALAWNIDPIDAGIRALQAGNTMIMYSHDIKSTQKIIEKIKKEVERNQELNNIVMANYQKIFLFKNKKI